MAEQAGLTIQLANVPDVRLGQLTRELDRDLSQAGIHIRSVASSSNAGERGDPVTLGALALALITSGAITAVIECFKAYLSRERGLVIKLTRADGTQIEVTGSNVDTPAVRATFEAVSLSR